jgi:hypothetical protein
MPGNRESPSAGTGHGERPRQAAHAAGSERGDGRAAASKPPRRGAGGGAGRGRKRADAAALEGQGQGGSGLPPVGAQGSLARGEGARGGPRDERA